VKLCRVIGSMVSTVKHRAFDGHKILYCQPVLAVDRVQAGVGDLVLVNQEGNGSRQLLGTIDGKLPIRSVIVGVVDDVHVA